MARAPGGVRGLAGTAARFGLVGVVATVFYFAQAQLLLRWGMRVEAAHLVAQATSLVFSYFAQKQITFRVPGRHRELGLRFGIATAILVATSYALVAGLDALEVEGAWVIVAATLFYPAASFLIHTFWTFAPREGAGGAA